MRILHVAEAFGGGLFETVRTVAEGSARSGHDVAIAYGIRPETVSGMRNEIDASVDLFPMPWTNRSWRSQVAAARGLYQVVRDYRPEIVHLHSSFSGVVGALAVGGTVPSIFSPHAYASALPDHNAGVRAAYRIGERFASRRATAVGAVSESEARFASEEAGARRVLVVRNGIPELDPGALANRRPRKGRPRVIAVGRTVPQRRPGACARILTALKDIADVAWVGGGGGSRGQDGRVALLRAGIEPTGWLPRDAVLDEFAAATAYLHWTSWDGNALSILEAMAYDAVVVASDIEPNRELLGPRPLCAGEDDAVTLLRRVLLDSDLAAELLADQRARRLAYGAERMVEGWIAAYEAVVEDIPAPVPLAAAA